MSDLYIEDDPDDDDTQWEDDEEYQRPETD